MGSTQFGNFGVRLHVLCNMGRMLTNRVRRTSAATPPFQSAMYVPRSTIGLAHRAVTRYFDVLINWPIDLHRLSRERRTRFWQLSTHRDPTVQWSTLEESRYATLNLRGATIELTYFRVNTPLRSRDYNQPFLVMEIRKKESCCWSKVWH